MTVDSEAAHAFTWDIELADSDLYRFQTTPSIQQLHGALLFCGDEMACNASIFDGATHFFRKAEAGE